MNTIEHKLTSCEIVCNRIPRIVPSCATDLREGLRSHSVIPSAVLVMFDVCWSGPTSPVGPQVAGRNGAVVSGNADSAAAALEMLPKDENTPLDPDLALIQDRWPNLPEHIKAAVLALVRSIPGKEQSV